MNRLVTTAHGLYGWINYLGWTAMAGVFIAIGRVLTRDPHRRFGLGALRWCWGRLMWATTPFWAREVRGLEHLAGGPWVIVANHQSTIDIPCLYGLPVLLTVSARTGIFHVPVMGPFLRWSGQIDTARLFTDGANALAAGISVVVFPEGSRSDDGALQRFHRGAFELAERTGTPVLPVAMDRARFIMARKAYWPSRPRVVVAVRVLEALRPTGDARDLERRTYDAIDRALTAIRAEAA